MNRFVIAGATVVPMARPGLLPDHSVVVEDGIITRVGPRDDVATDGMTVIDGTGRFVAPGLADMHVHWWEPGEGVLFVANGVTVVRNMFGDPIHLAMAKRVAQGTLVGPRLVTTSPIIDGAASGGRPMWPGSAFAPDRRRTRRRNGIAGRDAVTFLLHETGAPLLAGTDAPNPWVVPGFSLHDELARFVECGLSPYEALRTATTNAAEFLGEPGQWGVVAAGARADLVICASDPMHDVSALRHPETVVANGRAFTRADLDALLAARKHAITAESRLSAPELAPPSRPVHREGRLVERTAGTVTSCCSFRHSHGEHDSLVVEKEAALAGDPPSRRSTVVILTSDLSIRRAETTTVSVLGERRLVVDATGAHYEAVATDFDGHVTRRTITADRLVPTDSWAPSILGAVARTLLDATVGAEPGRDGPANPTLRATLDNGGYRVTIDRGDVEAELVVTATPDGGLNELRQPDWMGERVVAPGNRTDSHP